MRFLPAITLISLLALSGCSGGERATTHDEPPVPEGLLSSAEYREQGRDLFRKHCALCHGERGDGHGVRRTLSKPAADFTDPSWRQQTSPEMVFRAIHDGVPRSPMASWRFLEEEQIWALTAYILSLGESP